MNTTGIKTKDNSQTLSIVISYVHVRNVTLVSSLSWRRPFRAKEQGFFGGGGGDGSGKLLETAIPLYKCGESQWFPHKMRRGRSSEKPRVDLRVGIFRRDFVSNIRSSTFKRANSYIGVNME